MNVSITDFEAFTGHGCKLTEAFRFKNGLYLQKNLAKQLLQDFKQSNEQICNEFEVDMSLYGNYDISGVKDGEPEPCPRVWDDLRKTWSDDWKKALYDTEIEMFR